MLSLLLLLLQFMVVSFERADDANPGTARDALLNYTPDNTTVFSKKGDILSLGELVLPADADIKVRTAWCSFACTANMCLGHRVLSCCLPFNSHELLEQQCCQQLDWLFD